MHPYKLAVHILVILSVFSFVPVHAAPVPVQDVREACADVVNRGEDVILVSGKRAEEGQDPLTQASPGQGSTQGPSSTSDDAIGVHQGTINPTQLPSESSMSGEIQGPPYASGRTEPPWYSSDGSLVTPGEGEVQRDQLGTTSKLPSQPETSMTTETYSFAPVHWVPQLSAVPEIGPATPSESSGEIAPASSSRILPPSEQEGPPKPQSFLSKLASKPKSFFRKMGKIFKSLFSEMVDNPRLQIH